MSVKKFKKIFSVKKYKKSVLKIKPRNLNGMG